MACLPTSPLTEDHKSPQHFGTTFVISSISLTIPPQHITRKPMVWWNVSIANSKLPYVHVQHMQTGSTTFPGYSSAFAQLLPSTPTSLQHKLYLAVHFNSPPNFHPPISQLLSLLLSFPPALSFHLLPHYTTNPPIPHPVPISHQNSSLSPMSWSEKT